MIEQAGVAGGYFLVHRFVVGAAQCPHIGGNGVPAQLLVAQVGLKFFQCGPVELVEVNNLASAEFAESVQGTLIDVCRAITFLVFQLFNRFVHKLVEFFFISHKVPYYRFYIISNFHYGIEYRLKCSKQKDYLSNSASFIRIIQPFTCICKHM